MAWGFETNFGSLADFAVVKASQLTPMPPHLTWEEAACMGLCAGTAYRMLVSPRGAAMKQGWQQLGEEIRRQAGEDPHIVFEHAGRETFAASVYVARRGGTVVTCGSSTGYQHEYDNRHLWMKVKRIVGSHGANYQECWEANRLVRLGMLAPTLSVVHPLAEVAEATRAVQLNLHTGKVAVLCLAPHEGMGAADPTLRGMVGEDRLRMFRGR